MRSLLQRSVMGSVLLAVSLFALASCGNTTSAKGSLGPAADFTLKDETGEDYNFSENTEGKVVILNFWAKRCPACKVEIPNLVEIYGEYADSGLEVIGVDVDASGVAAMKAASSQYGIDYPLLSGTSREIGRIVSSYGSFRFIPTTYIIDREGNITEKLSGPKGKAYLEGAVKKLL
ncbi:MAG TPA: TlpA disulfide reductase family protein [Candidatus Omnitrophota bacterium]|nr:TlpA disulfide reductase family protein [Candidatus Omnitrophota bacterium]